MSDKFEHRGYQGTVREDVHPIDPLLYEAAIYRPGYGVVYGAAKTREQAIEKAKHTFDTMDWSKLKPRGRGGNRR